WDGSIPTSQSYYSGADCTGTAYLNSGGPGVSPWYAKTLVFLGSANTLAAPAVLDASGSAPNSAFTVSGIDNPACGPSTGEKNGWQLATVTPATAGLPAGTTNQLAVPLTTQ
ncbi:hypothetical protein, partial [Nocardioides sp.]|uniref:hypothetical protein n=1 Tax=Nocardioides sp. TaxID=35761 RepID=UPI002732C564